MDFSVNRTEDNCYRKVESKVDSKTQLVFVSGLFNGEVWKQQYNYFARNHKTLVLDCLKGGRSYDKQKEMISQVLNKRDDLDDVVLISHGLGNSLIQDLESKESVVATVMTGVMERPYKTYSNRFYRGFTYFIKREPKIFKKLFFSELTDYRVCKDFVKNAEFPSFNEIESFINNYSMRTPVKKSMIIHPENDKWASKDYSRKLTPKASVSIIKDSGPYCFYEKPQEYNKAVRDFLERLEEFIENRDVSIAKKNNHSLKDFEKQTREQKKKVRI